MRGGHGFSRASVVRMRGRHACRRASIASAGSHQRLEDGSAHDPLVEGVDAVSYTHLPSPRD
eukprot:14346821-Alexandrium_andersonii.AAC.1